jgi:WD40 repeat protein
MSASPPYDILTWKTTAVANRTITLPAGSYALHTQNNQRGTIVVSGAASGTATITAVTTGKALAHHQGLLSSGTFVTGEFDLVLTNTTTLTVTCASGAGVGTTSYEVEDTV